LEVKEEIDTRLTVCSSEDLLPDVTQQAVPSSSVDYAVPPVHCSSVDYVCRVCRQACVDEPAQQSMIALTLLSFLKQSRSSLQLHADLSVYPKFWGR